MQDIVKMIELRREFNFNVYLSSFNLPVAVASSTKKE